MKRVIHTLCILTIVLLTTFLQSCSEEKYTVWTTTMEYYEFIEATNITIDDGYYIRYELSSSEWETIAKSLTKEGKHRWDEATIKKWLISYGFGETESVKESSWFAVIEHGFLVMRNGSQVSFILK